MEQVGGVKIQFAERAFRQIAPAFLQVCRQITEDIDQLKPLPEANTATDKLSDVGARFWRKVLQANARPEFSDASGNSISVIVQLRIILQRENILPGSQTESLQVEFLSSCDRLKHAPDQLLIRCGSLKQKLKRLINPFEENSFAGV